MDRPPFYTLSVLSYQKIEYYLTPRLTLPLLLWTCCTVSAFRGPQVILEREACWPNELPTPGCPITNPHPSSCYFARCLHVALRSASKQSFQKPDFRTQGHGCLVQGDNVSASFDFSTKPIHFCYSTKSTYGTDLASVSFASALARSMSTSLSSLPWLYPT